MAVPTSAPCVFGRLFIREGDKIWPSRYSRAYRRTGEKMVAPYYRRSAATTIPLRTFPTNCCTRAKDSDLGTLLSVDPEPFALEASVFINVSGEFILRTHAQALPRDRFVLVMPGDVDATKPMVRAITETRNAGCGIA